MPQLLWLLFMSQTFQDLQPNAEISGFQAQALYRNAQEQPMGGRFQHKRSGFVLDLIEIQSVPQGYLCVKTHPTSNMGEPHTQEHLLLGKGNVGRKVAAQETMSLVTSTAFTAQLKTCYPFNTTAGIDVFFASLERSLHAYLHPDYTDEEIRREVRHFGVKKNAQGQLELEEKGTIYAEMVSATTQPGYRAYRAMGRLVFGPEHPMSFDSGGDPKYIRLMEPHHIRKFHADNYYLGNMELIASLPKGAGLGETLARFDAILSKLQGDKGKQPPRGKSDLPAPRGAAEGTVQIVDFPSRNPQQPGPASFAWPVQDALSPLDAALAEVFSEAFGGDPSTNLYKLFVDSKTRKLDLGARSVAMGFDNEAYARFSVYVPDLGSTFAQPERLREIRALVLDELRRVAGWADGSPELEEFHQRMEANLIRTKRSLDKLTSSPPGFGGRGSSSMWPGLLEELAEQPGFAKSVVQKQLIAEVETVLRTRKNIWKEKLVQWKLLEKLPYAVAAKAAPELIAQEEAEYQARLAQEVARLREHYQVNDDQAAIRRYAADYDRATEELERQAAATGTAKFLDNPPLHLDEQLDYREEKVAGKIPLVTGIFSGMNSANVGLVLNIGEWTGRQLLYAAAFPTLLTGSGMSKDGEKLSFEEAQQRMRREILSLSAYYVTNPVTGRKELVLSAAGNNLSEAKVSLGWLRAALEAPRWEAENLPRLRDQVDQILNGLRTTMQRSEETWVNNPSSAWLYQTDPLYLSVSSFLTRQQHLLRLRWLLRDPAGAAEQEAMARFFADCAALENPSKEALEALAGGMQPEFQAMAQEAIKDLAYVLADLPASSREADWNFVVQQMAKDYREPAQAVLAGLDRARRQLLRKANARFFLTASAENAAALKPELEKLAGMLSEQAAAPRSPGSERVLARRVMEREKSQQEPVYVALTAPNMQGGVFMNSAPFVKLRDVDEDASLRFLASKLYAGGGPHGVFMKTWGAGLAYSNGLRSSGGDGRIAYYAERTPELPQTLSFVIRELKRAPRDLPLAEYALSQVFQQSRADGSFEGRTSAMAEDLADGNGPEVVRAFRSAILRVRSKSNLDAALYERMDSAYALVLPGYDPEAKPPAGANYFVIGPEKQLRAWETYLQSQVKDAAPLVRLYPRDFWILCE